MKNSLKLFGWMMWYMLCIVLGISIFLTVVGILLALIGHYAGWLMFITLLGLTVYTSYQLAKHKLSK